MRTRTRIPLTALILLFIVIWPAMQIPSRAEAQLQVPFVLLRLDPWTLDLLGGYGFHQPYRKSLMPDCPWHSCVEFTVGDVFIHYQEPLDFGRTGLISRLTGQPVFEATSVWAGSGQLIWPTPAESLPDLSRGPAAGEPSLFTVWYGIPQDRARQAWESVRDLRAVSDLAADPFGVFVTYHEYSIPGRTELLVLVYGKPVAPRDAGIVRVDWPQGLLADGVSTVPEARLVNFSDEPLDAEIVLDVLQGSVVVRRSRRAVADLAADGQVTVLFDPVAPVGPTPMSFRWKLAGPGGYAWSDAFQDNDALERAVEVVRLPVYRQFPVTAFLRSYLIDFDDDGDLDLVRYDFDPRFYRNDAGTYVNITSSVAASLPHWPVQALAADFTGDGRSEVVLVPFTLLTPDGAGGFRNITPDSGLAGVATGAIVPHDVEGDGDLDLLTQVSGAVRVYLNDGSARFMDGTAGSGIEPIATRSVSALAQVSGDERPDLVIAGWSVLSSIYEDVGGGRFLKVADLPDSQQSRHAAIFDYDRDGLPDIHVTGFSQNRLFRQQSPLSFVEVSATAGYMGEDGLAQPFDMDADGWVDLAVDFPPRLVRNNHGVLEDETRLLIPPPSIGGVGRQIQPRLLDLDGDGDEDLYYFYTAYRNLGLPRPTAGVRVERIALGSRGYLHLVVYGSEAFDVRSIDPASLTFGPDAAPPGHRGCPHLEDHDSDGHLDLLMHVRLADAGLEPGEVGCLDAVVNGTILVRGCEGAGAAARIGRRRSRSGQ